MIALLYEILLWIGGILILPKTFTQYMQTGRHGGNFLPRVIAQGFPQIEKGNKKLYWIHGVSVGEIKAISALGNRIKKIHPDCIIVVSTVTETGQEEAKRCLASADYHVYLPFDYRFLMKRIMKRLRPDWVILSEGDLWYNFLRCAKDQGEKIAVLNAKLSERSLNRFKKVKFLALKMYSLVDFFCIQNEVYLERFIGLGLDPQKLHVTGNLKLDEVYPELDESERSEWRQRLGIKESDLVLTCGSTHEPEEKYFLESLEVLWKQFPQLKVLLVPRHPLRFPVVAKLLEEKKIPFRKYSDESDTNMDVRVILVDAMGILRHCYQLSDLAFVGGTYNKSVGGHNLLEPCFYGIPVFFGPYTYSQPGMPELLDSYGAGERYSLEDLKEKLSNLLENQVQRNEMGSSGKRLMEENRGALDKSWNLIFQNEELKA